MAFVDELNIHIKAGKGGDGVVRWLHEKGKEFMGPAGGDGGKGGDVYVRAVSDLNILFRYKNKKEFAAGNGGDGANKSMHGKDGEDLVIDVPIGSVITNLTTGKKVELNAKDEKAFLLKGGRGGWGNEHFKASTNIRPQESTLGRDAEESDFLIEVELAVTAGLIGLPNAGKSSLLNALTNADAKIGDYQFTTLEPNLGDLYGFILADIPGLIEGASEGKGLGHKFLRHIKRTKMLFHCISLQNEDLMETYNVVRNELDTFDDTLKEKKEIIILTKTDAVDEATVKKSVSLFKKKKHHVLTVSIYDDESIKNLKDEMVKILRELQ